MVWAIFRVYLACRLFRLLVPMLAVALIATAILAVRPGHSPAPGSATGSIIRGAAAGRRDCRGRSGMRSSRASLRALTDSRRSIALPTSIVCARDRLR
jgi:hypothetical protein